MGSERKNDVTAAATAGIRYGFERSADAEAFHARSDNLCRQIERGVPRDAEAAGERSTRSLGS